jgi:hypothetical protein
VRQSEVTDQVLGSIAPIQARQMNALTPDLADSFVVEESTGWPGGERVLEEDEGFEQITSSLSSSLLLAAMQDDTHQDALLDALARLEEERQRSQRLMQQVDLARALAGLPMSDRPARAATTVAAAWRGRTARTQLSATRQRKYDHAVRICQMQIRQWRARRAACLQRRVLAAGTLRRALSDYVKRVPHPTRSALASCELRHQQQLVSLEDAHASKEAGLACALLRVDERRLVVERALGELTASHEELLSEHEALRAEQETLRAAHESLQAEHDAMQARVACSQSSALPEESQSALAASASCPPAPASPSPDGSSSAEGAACARCAAAALAIHEEDHRWFERKIGELKSDAAVERAQFLDQLDEQRKALQRLEEKLTSAALAKEQAEELASSLLAEKLAREVWPAESQGSILRPSPNAR